MNSSPRNSSKARRSSQEVSTHVGSSNLPKSCKAAGELEEYWKYIAVYKRLKFNLEMRQLVSLIVKEEIAKMRSKKV